MNQVISVTVSGSLARSFLTTFTQADTTVKNLTKSVGFLDKAFTSLNKTLTASGKLISDYKNSAVILSRRNDVLATSANKVSSATAGVGRAMTQGASALSARKAATDSLTTSNRNLAQSITAVQNAARTPIPQLRNRGGPGGGAPSQLVEGIADASLIYGGEKIVKYGALNPIEAFADFESAANDLKSTMTTASGAIDPLYDKTVALAAMLGNKLPGTKKDFIAMMNTLRMQGSETTDIVNGLGEATANLSVLIHESPASTAMYSSMIQKATRTKGTDMIALLDVVQRSSHLGVNPADLSLAFGRSSGGFIEAGMTGLENAKKMATIYTMFLQTGLNPNTVGTNFTRFLSEIRNPKTKLKADMFLASQGMDALTFTDQSGKFLGPEHMLAEFSKLRSLDENHRKQYLSILFGEGLDEQMGAQIINDGVEGYKAMQERMNTQADLQQRIEIQRSGMLNKWKAMTGTFTNVMKSTGQSVQGPVKAALDMANSLLTSVDSFINTAQGQKVARGGVGLAALFGGSLIFRGALGLARTKLGQGIIRAIIPGFIRNLFMSALWNPMKAIGGRVISAGLSAAMRAGFSLMPNLMTRAGIGWAAGGLRGLVGAIGGPMAAVVAAAVGGWMIGNWIEKKTGIGSKTGEMIGDWIWGDTIRKAQQVPKIVEQSMKDVQLRTKGLEANKERDDAIAATKAEIARLDKVTDVDLQNDSPSYGQDNAEQRVAESHLRELLTQKARLTNSPLAPFWNSQTKMANLHLWKQEAGMDDLTDSFNESNVSKLIKSGKLTPADLKSVIDFNDSADVPDANKLAPKALEQVKEMYERVTHGNNGGPVTYQIQELHVNNPVGSMKDIHKYVPPLIKKAINDDRQTMFGRDRAAMNDLHTSPN